MRPNASKQMRASSSASSGATSRNVSCAVATTATLAAACQRDAVADRQHDTEPAVGAQELGVQRPGGLALLGSPARAEVVGHLDFVRKSDRPAHQDVVDDEQCTL